MASRGAVLLRAMGPALFFAGAAAWSGEAVRTGALIAEITVTPASIDPGVKPNIICRVLNLSTDANGRPAKARLDVRFVIRTPGGDTVKGAWRDVAVDLGVTEFTSDRDIDTAAPGKYTASFSVHEAGVSAALATRSAEFLVRGGTTGTTPSTTTTTTTPKTGTDQGPSFIDQGEATTTAPAMAKHSVKVEFRATDVFDLPLDAGLGPPPNFLVNAQGRTWLNAKDDLALSAEQLVFKDSTQNWGWSMLEWGHFFEGNYRTVFGAGASWDNAGKAGWTLSAQLEGRAGPNLDYKARVQGTQSPDGDLGWRLDLTGTAIITPEVKAYSRMRYFVNEKSEWNFWDEAGLAWQLDKDTAVQGMLRLQWGEQIGTETDPITGITGDAVLPEESYVASLGVKHNFTPDFMGRVAYHGFSGRSGTHSNLNAHGLLVGAQWAVRKDLKIGGFYRFYVTNERMFANTAGVSAAYSF
jgi:hypothetical protein